MTSAFVNFRFFKRLMLVLDFLGFSLIVLAVYRFRLDEWPIMAPEQMTLMILLCGLLVVNLYLWGAYNLQTRILSHRFTLRTLLGVLSFSIVLATALFVTRSDVAGLFGRGVLLGSSFIFLLYGMVHRAIIIRYLCAHSQGQKWLVLLSEEYREEFLQDVAENHQGENYTVLSTGSAVQSDSNEHFNWAGDLSKLDELARESWFGIIVALSEKDLAPISEKLMKLRFSGHRPMNLTDYYELRWQKMPVYFLDESWFVFSDGFNLFQNPVRLRFKRLCDFCGGIFLFVLCLPIMALTYLIVRIESPGPAIFKQTRTGENNRDFTIFKFRSMRMDAEQDGAQWASKSDNRVTRVGNFIRKTRLDELPQFWNVIRGDMSFIGPRPERPEFNSSLEKEIPHYQLRHSLKPGISGWAQVMYPYGASVKDSVEKLKYELFYIKNYSIYLDFIIIFKTIRVILGGKGR